MLKAFCNGCGREIENTDQIKAVRLIEATLPGLDHAPGLAPDPTTEGHLCVETCIPLLHALIDERIETTDLGLALDDFAVLLRERADEVEAQGRKQRLDAVTDQFEREDEADALQVNGAKTPAILAGVNAARERGQIDERGGVHMSEQETPAGGEETTDEPTEEPAAGDGGDGGDGGAGEDGGDGGDGGESA